MPCLLAARRLRRSENAHGELIHALLQKCRGNQVMAHAGEAGEAVHRALANERTVPIYLIELRRGSELQHLRRTGLLRG